MDWIFRDFEVQTDLLNPIRRSDRVAINKKKRTCRLANFACSCESLSENESNCKSRHIPRFCLRANKAVELEGYGDTKCNRGTWNNP